MKTRSALARGQQIATLALAVAGLAWLAWQWPRSPALAIAGPALLWLGHSVFLALEFLALRAAGPDDGVPQPTWPQLVRALLAETWLNVLVFAWYQPFRWNAIPDHLPAAPASGARRGVVLVHGIVCNRGFWTPWLKELRRRDIPFVAVNLEPAFGSIEGYVPIIEDAVQRVTQATGQPPILVCHSMGGLAARAWLRAAGGDKRVHHVLTIGSPHHGAWLARFSHARNGRQMRLDGDWVRGLAAVAPAGSGARFTCWYSNCDNMVFPVTSATLPGADNRLVRGPAHLELAYHPEVMARSLEQIAG